MHGLIDETLGCYEPLHQHIKLSFHSWAPISYPLLGIPYLTATKLYP